MRTPGQVARLLGIHVETLRYYEGLGLLPKPTRTAGGRRVYSDESIKLLRSIRLARRLGLRLSEIRAILPAKGGTHPQAAEVLAALERALARTRAELQLLNSRRRNLMTLAAAVRGLRADADLRTELRDAWVHLEQMPEKRGSSSRRVRPSSG